MMIRKRWKIEKTKTYHEVAVEGLLKPDAARAEDVLVELPCLVLALDRHVGEQPRLEQSVRRVRLEKMEHREDEKEADLLLVGLQKTIVHNS